MSDIISMTFGEYTFDPTPQITISNEVVRDNAGSPVNIITRATLDGVLDGHPTGGFSSLQPLKAEIEGALLQCSGCQLFQLICGTSGVGYKMVEAYARVVDLTFEPSADNWIFTIPYTATLVWDAPSSLLASGDFSCYKCLTSTNEEWSVSVLDSPKAYTIPGCSSNSQFLQVSHNVSAQGINCCVSGIQTYGWENARSWVSPRLGFDSVVVASSGVFNFDPSQLTSYEHSRTQSVNETTGDFSVSEGWIVTTVSGARACTEEFVITEETSIESPFRTVNIQGTITGLEERNSNFSITTTKYENALSCWNLISPILSTRVNCAVSGGVCPLNGNAISTSVAHNPTVGSINYAYTYNDKPTLVSGAKYENISISDVKASERVGSVDIIGRTAGPLLMSTNSLNQRRRTCTIDIVLPNTDCYSTPSNISTIINSMPPSGVTTVLVAVENQLLAAFDNVYRVSDQENYTIGGYTYSRTVEWWYSDCSWTLPTSGVF